MLSTKNQRCINTGIETATVLSICMAYFKLFLQYKKNPHQQTNKQTNQTPKQPTNLSKSPNKESGSQHRTFWFRCGWVSVWFDFPDWIMLQENNRNSIQINIWNKQTSGCYFCTLIIWSNLETTTIQIHRFVTSYYSNDRFPSKLSIKVMLVGFPG